MNSPIIRTDGPDTNWDALDEAGDLQVARGIGGVHVYDSARSPMVSPWVMAQNALVDDLRRPVINDGGAQ